MKKALGLAALLTVLPLASLAAPAGFVNPLTFKGSEAEKASVVKYIQTRVQNEMKVTGMNNASTARMMEESNLTAFKALTSVESKDTLKKVIDNYCNRIDMCGYATLKLMYDKELKDSKKSLSW
ncbi:hypothetical protein [Dickeya lacustris]|uniref:Uncharacterized protein n=1 Tax=Dickeya lacustris TaxID=2259638 RepID=A0ABY8GAK8_9GAMM|nr:hypothetical protein [Dickeya lacustris]WFN56991.1 hypothetical protein O1Q98_07110 [Dickeya lacustris]